MEPDPDLLDLAALRAFLRDFADRRDWHQFHGPKNLVMALAGEVGELTELFQWLTPEESAEIMADPAKAQAVRDEFGDILQYLVRLADVLDVDLSGAVWDKVRRNEDRYPVEQSRGSAAKYTELGEE